MTPEEYFSFHQSVNKKRYDALHAFFTRRLTASEVAATYGYTLTSFYSLVRDFRKYLNEGHLDDFFFKDTTLGRKPSQHNGLKDLIISLRKMNYAIEEIVSIANSKSFEVSYGLVYKILHEEGFARLLRRSNTAKKQLPLPLLKSPVADKITWKAEKFHSSHTGLLAFLPLITHYGIHRLIERSDYPAARNMSKLSSILCFLALKLSNIKRNNHDDLWCMDRGMGLFAGLNVLPNTAWYNSYSYKVSSGMNLTFLKEMNKVWLSHGLLSNTSNLDYTSIPCWSDPDTPEYKRNEKPDDGEMPAINQHENPSKILSSQLTILAQDPKYGFIDYGNCNIVHHNEHGVVLELLDFYHTFTVNKEILIKYLTFDGKFTNYQNLSELDDQQFKFITIRRRGEKMMEQILNITVWKTVQIEVNEMKKRSYKVKEQAITVPGYKNNETGVLKTLRQVVIIYNIKHKPSVLLTNDFELPIELIIQKYARRWIDEKDIACQIDFFHFNRPTSSMVNKVGFDMVMTILAHNLYRLLAKHLDGCRHLTGEQLYDKFIANSGEIIINESEIRIDLKKKKSLPLLMQYLDQSKMHKYTWLENKTIHFNPTHTS